MFHFALLYYSLMSPQSLFSGVNNTGGGGGISIIQYSVALTLYFGLRAFERNGVAR